MNIYKIMEVLPPKNDNQNYRFVRLENGQTIYCSSSSKCYKWAECPNKFGVISEGPKGPYIQKIYGSYGAAAYKCGIDCAEAQQYAAKKAAQAAKEAAAAKEQAARYAAWMAEREAICAANRAAREAAQKEKAAIAAMNWEEFQTFLNQLKTEAAKEAAEAVKNNIKEVNIQLNDDNTFNASGDDSCRVEDIGYPAIEKYLQVFFNNIQEELVMKYDLGFYHDSFGYQNKKLYKDFYGIKIFIYCDSQN